jgi:hypothetical protein
MASRENTGLQAAVIVLAIFFLISIVGMVLLNNARKTAIARATSAEQSAQTASGNEATMRTEAGELKTRMGFPAEDTLPAITAAVDAIMARYPELPPEGRTFKAVLEMVSEERQKLVLNLSSATEEIKSLKDRLLAVESQKEEQVKKFQAEMEQVRADAAKARTDFDEDRSRMTSENEGYQKKLAELQTAHDEAMAKLETDKSELETQIVKLQQSIEKLRLGLPDVDQFAQPADGRIIGVEQGFATVTINLGSADGLRPQVTFSVSDAGLDDAAAAEKKGSIEVTRILGPHMAEAKITSDAAVNPLLRGDRVYSQVWDRGRQVGFGIAGIIDVDDDGTSDLDRLKAIIGAGGGVVDAAPDASGAQQGNLKVSTRYLILGEYPTDGRHAAFQQSWNDLSEEAETLGIETISVGEFLSLMGWKSETRSVAMGAGSRAEDFPPEARGQDLPRKTGQPAGAFKRRLPTSTY